jgi:hypothetical protein
MKHFIFVLVLFVGYIFGIYANPYRCEQISLELTTNVTSNFSFSLTTNLQLTEKSGKTYISYSNFSTTSDGDDFIDFLCFAYNDTIFCANETEQIFVNGNHTIGLWAHLGDHNTTIPIKDLWPIFDTMIDEISFSLITGELFTSDKPCYTDLSDLGLDIGKQCCTSFKPVRQPSINYRCKEFNSRTIIYNIDDNYSIYATSQVNYQLENKTLEFEANFYASDDIHVEYDYNDNYICWGTRHSPITNCSLTLPSYNSKIFIEMTTRNDSDTDFFVPMGRLLLRDGQALIEEGISFTPQNNCQYLSSTINFHQVFSTKFCCSEFE